LYVRKLLAHPVELQNTITGVVSLIPTHATVTSFGTIVFFFFWHGKLPHFSPIKNNDVFKDFR